MIGIEIDDQPGVTCYTCQEQLLSWTLSLCSFLINDFMFFFVGNSPLDSHDGGTTASWVWACGQSLVRGIQDAFKGTDDSLVFSFNCFM